ncbi:MAG: Asp-tRNA(Asn)/Glu-tRNA(Gln) amidotransferase subunit GatA [Acidobacteriota bacterium]
MAGLIDLSLPQMRAGLDARQFSCRDLVMAHLERIEAVDPVVNAFLHINREGALAAADQYDLDLARRGPASLHKKKRPLAGIPVALKDIICTKEMPTTCGSRLLEGYAPPYDATVTARLRAAGAILVGKTNMDEFAMGSSCENSAYGPTHNPLALDRVPGGSSGGSAAAVAAKEVPLSVGTDTGGSVRQPAALCGVVGMKPTYGRVSRYGLVAFASSLDQAGPLARTVADARLLLEALWGHDPPDSTTVRSRPEPAESAGDLSRFTFGVLHPPPGSGLKTDVAAAFKDALRILQKAGARVEEVQLPHAEAAIPAYYLVATAEASANLARFDGVRFGNRPAGPAAGLREMYQRIRTERFGVEVQRRIMLGTFALAAGYYDTYYLKAQKLRTVLRRDFDQLFRKVDLLLSPTSPTVAFPLGEKQDDPLAMYLTDVFTVPASLAGLPALSLPCGLSDGLPVGLQVVGDRLKDHLVLEASGAIESALALPPFSLQVGA